MLFPNQRVELYDQLLALLENSSLKSLPSFLRFKTAWGELLRKNIFEQIVTYTKGGNDGQAFEKKLFLPSDYEITFTYDITHLRGIFKDEKKSGMHLFFYPCPLENRNGNISLMGSNCLFNYFSKSERKSHYSDMSEIFISLMPLLPFEYFMVDGNHRISSLIDTGMSNIPAYLINPEYTPLFLTTSAEMVTFAFLLDLASLYMELEAKDSRTNELLIFKQPSILTVLKGKGRLR